MAISWIRKAGSAFRRSRGGLPVRPVRHDMASAFEQLEERKLLDGLIHDEGPGPVVGGIIEGTPISLVNGEAFRTGSFLEDTLVSFQIYGPGKAVVTPVLDTIHGPPVAYDVEITGSTSETSFFVQDVGGIVKLRDVSVQGSLAVLYAPSSDLIGNVAVLNGLGAVYLDDIYNDGMISQDPTFVPSFSVGTDKTIRDTSLYMGEVNSLLLNVQGTIRTLAAERVASAVDESGKGSVQIVAENILRFSTMADFSGGVLSASGQIGTVNIAGGIYNAGIYAEDGIYQVNAQAMHESKVAAGVNLGEGYLPTDDSQFTNKDAAIRSVWLYGMPPSEPTGGVGLPLQSSFFVSGISAWRVDSVYIGDVTPSSSVDFGVSANSVGMLSYLRPALLGEETTPPPAPPVSGGHGSHGGDSTGHEEHTGADPDGLVRVTHNNLTRPDDPRLHTGITGFEVEIFAPGYIVPNYQETPVYASENGVLDVHLTMANTTVSINDGQYVFQGQTYNGGFPGPTLRVKPGDILRITLTNNIDTPTNLHTHGLHVSPLGNSDNVFISLAPGETMEYMYQIPADHPEGLYWYHPHKHHLVDSQVVMGLSGLLIVERDGGGVPEFKDLTQRYMSIRNVPLDNGVINTNLAPADQLFIVNNQINPIIGIAPGETQVWNIGNIGNDGWYDLYLDNGQPLQIVGIDGNPMTSVMSVDSFQLAPGQRLSILVSGDEIGQFHLMTKGFDQGFQVWPEAMLATVAVQGKQQEPFIVPATLNPYNNFYTDLRDVAINQTVNLEFQIKFGPEGVTFPINGKVYDPDRIDVTAILNTVDEWVLTNSSTDWHPFHIHVNPFQVIEINGVPVDYGTFQDVVGIPPIQADGTLGSVKIRMKYTDFVGEYVFHCHILVHEDGGMMGNILVTQPGYNGYPGSGGGGHGGHEAAGAASSGSVVNTLEEADGVTLKFIE